jgi:RNA polymerase-associated protein LEO1
LDDDDDDKEESADKQASEKPRARVVIDDDEDDDDEGDVEFDDAGAVVGSSAPAQKTTKAAAKRTDNNTNDDEETTEGGAAVSNNNNNNKAPVKPPQRAVVLEADRPAEGVSIHMTKLPNLVGVQPDAFEEDTYEAAEEEDFYRGYVHNMIRWRYKREGNNNTGNPMRDEDGKLIRESNSRIVQWEDGSFTLHIGNETFEVDAVDSVQKSTGFPGLNGYMYLSQKATFSNNEKDAAAADADQEEEGKPGGTVLECMQAVTSRLVTRPSSLQSEAHKSLTVAVRQRTIKKARIEAYVTQEDPEKAKEARIRLNEDTDKIASRKRSGYNKSTSASTSASTSSRQRTPGMNRRYLEEDDEAYDTTNIRDLKRRPDNMDDDMDDYGEDSDADDDGADATFRKDRKRKKQVEEDEDEDEEELVFDNDSDEDDVTLIKAHKKKRVVHHQAVVDDEDED